MDRQAGWQLHVDLAGLGLSLVDIDRREIAYMTLTGMTASVVDSAVDQAVSVTVQKYAL